MTREYVYETHMNNICKYNEGAINQVVDRYENVLFFLCTGLVKPQTRGMLEHISTVFLWFT